MAVIIFIWVFSLPILFITSVLWLPIGSALIITTASISFYIQWHHADTIIVQSVWRDMISCIPIADWFESYNVHGNVPPPRTLILAHPHGILCCGMIIYHFQQKNTVKELLNRGGLRCEILSSGKICVNDQIIS